MISTITFLEMVNNLKERLLQTPEKITGIRLSQDSWSLKEIIGHLIDSASNNHQRFVRLQEDDLLNFPDYDTEKWIKVQKYNDMNWNVLITLWYSYNLILMDVIEHMDANSMENVWICGEEAFKLEFLIKEYYSHMEWHIQQFCDRADKITEVNA